MVDHLLEAAPALAVYLLIAGVVMTESLGVPAPGELTLVSAALLAAQHKLAIAPGWIAACGSAGAIVGDSIGYLIGRRFGGGLFGWLGRRFPAHFSPRHVAFAERYFAAHGAWAVFFGRFVAVLRIFAGPLAGSLKMPYRRFLAANAGGGILWATGLTFLVYSLGVAAEQWLSRFSWLGLAVAAIFGLVVTLLIRRKTRRMIDEAEPPGSGEVPADARADAAGNQAARAQD